MTENKIESYAIKMAKLADKDPDLLSKDEELEVLNYLCEYNGFSEPVSANF